MAVKDNISNIEGLENNTILKTLQNVIKYVKENAVKGDKGDTGSVGPVGPEGKSIIDIQVISSSVVGENTINTIKVMYNTGETEDFTISCKNGVNGAEGPAGPTGSTGVGIASIENKGYTDGTDFTITHIEVTLTNGETETFDVQAQRGATGPVGPAGEPADIRSVTLTGVSQGSISTEDLQLLALSNSNYIILNNEIYLLMDKQLASGYLVYSHIGQDSTNNYFVKCITITISTQAWVMTETQLGGGGASPTLYTPTNIADLYNKLVELFNAKKDFIVYLTPSYDVKGSGYSIATTTSGTTINNTNNYVILSTNFIYAFKPAHFFVPNEVIYLSYNGDKEQIDFSINSSTFKLLSTETNITSTQISSTYLDSSKVGASFSWLNPVISYLE